MAMEKQKSETTTLSKKTFGTWRKQRGWSPLKIMSANECYLYDESGKKYLDFSSQLVCSNLGHANRRIIDAIINQAERLPYISPSFDTDIREEASEKLSTITPSNLKKFFFSTGGSEANEAAIKISRIFNSKSNKNKIFSFYNSYHGATLGSLQMTGDYRRPTVDSYYNAPGFVHIPRQYCYKCPFGLEYPDCNISCAEYVEHAIKAEGNVGALIIEPIPGANGVIIPPKEYMPRIREITEENDVLLIADEVMTGFGRTGEWFAVDHWKVKPDIMTMAKGITGAYAPLGVTAVSGQISDFFEDTYFPHGHTYEAHPLALAAASAAIDEYRERHIVEHVKSLNPYFMDKLLWLKENHPSVGDVRGVGLFGAIELVKNRKTREPFNSIEEKIDGKPVVAEMVAKEAMSRGVYVYTFVTRLIIAPPLISTEKELDEGFEAVDISLKLADSLIKN